MATLTIPDDVFARIAARAARDGVPVEAVAVPLLETCDPSRSKPFDPVAALAAMARFDALAQEFGKHLPPGHHVEDTREALYADDRGSE